MAELTITNKCAEYDGIRKTYVILLAQKTDRHKNSGHKYFFQDTTKISGQIQDVFKKSGKSGHVGALGMG